MKLIGSYIRNLQHSNEWLLGVWVMDDDSDWDPSKFTGTSRDPEFFCRTLPSWMQPTPIDL